MAVLVWFAFGIWAAVLATAAFCILAEVVLFVRDVVTEQVRRSRTPEVEAEVSERLKNGELSVARPVIPGIVPLDEQKYASAECELYPANRGRQRVAMFGIAVIVLAALVPFIHGSVGVGVYIVWSCLLAAGIVWVTIRHPSTVTRVRYRVQVGDVASRHGGQYVGIDHPGDGWDLAGFTQAVRAANRDWTTMSDMESQVSRWGDPTQPTDRPTDMSILDEHVIFAIRFESGLRCEYGKTKLRMVPGHTPPQNRYFFYFYVLAEINRPFQLCLRRRAYLSPREQSHSVPDGSVLDPLYEIEPGYEEVFARLSPRTRQMMADARLDKMVVSGNWAMLWWDGRTNWSDAMYLGKDLDWDGRMDMSSERTWDGVDKVRAMLASMEDDQE